MKSSQETQLNSIYGPATSCRKEQNFEEVKVRQHPEENKVNEEMFNKPKQNYERKVKALFQDLDKCPDYEKINFILRNVSRKLVEMSCSKYSLKNFAMKVLEAHMMLYYKGKKTNRNKSKWRLFADSILKLEDLDPFYFSCCDGGNSDLRDFIHTMWRKMVKKPKIKELQKKSFY